MSEPTSRGVTLGENFRPPEVVNPIAVELNAGTVNQLVRLGTTKAITITGRDTAPSLIRIHFGPDASYPRYTIATQNNIPFRVCIRGNFRELFIPAVPAGCPIQIYNLETQ